MKTADDIRRELDGGPNVVVLKVKREPRPEDFIISAVELELHIMRKSGWISDHDIESWNEKVPEWKREGSASFDKHLDELKKKVDATTKSMTDSNHADEARKLKDKFNRWLSQVRN